MLNPSYERAPESDTPSPVREPSFISNLKESLNFEDSMGGLQGVFMAEEQGAVSKIEKILNLSYFLN